MTYFSLFSLLGVIFVYPFFTTSMATSRVSAIRGISESETKYTKAHSLGDSYKFNSADGWKTVNVTNLAYKYRRDSGLTVSDGEQDSDLETRTDSRLTERKSGKADSKKPSFLDTIFKGLKGVGDPQTVTITWYTGHDLQNPSCWSHTAWAPTDASFACALTQDGWTNHPKCFKFIELCNTPQKCVYVRVVDTCAGCAKGSRHVDLTRAAFKELADLDEGKISVKFRLATEPETWHEALWGPKVN